MKTLYDLKKHESGRVKKLLATGDLKTRLLSFGIQKGATIEILECAPAKQTMQIKVDSMKLALRLNEAKEIAIDE